jgi:hypothetical protein
LPVVASSVIVKHCMHPWPSVVSGSVLLKEGVALG